MPFEALFVAHAPDAGNEQHRGVINSGKYQLFTVVVRNQREAEQVCRSLVDGERVDSVVLCPGFTNANVAAIAKAVGRSVAVSVARGDGPSARVSLAARERAGYMHKRRASGASGRADDRGGHGA